MSVEAFLAGEQAYHVEQGDCIAFMNALPADSVALVMCSPPYMRARSYLESGEDLGIARGCEEWTAWMVEVCTAARRVCTGLCVFVVEGQTRDFRYQPAPFLLLADLHRRGFHLRKPPVYHRVGIPGSGGPDWWRNDWEPCVCFARGGKLPWSDNVACGAPPKYMPGGAMSYRNKNGTRKNRQECPRAKITRGSFNGDTQQLPGYIPPDLANPGNVIKCNVGGDALGSTLAHDNEAPYSAVLCEAFIRSFAPPGGVVLDPFSGSGTTLAVAVRHGRRGLACDLRQSQVDLTKRRLLEGSETRKDETIPGPALDLFPEL
jgi:hypothetical protein